MGYHMDWVINYTFPNRKPSNVDYRTSDSIVSWVERNITDVRIVLLFQEGEVAISTFEKVNDDILKVSREFPEVLFSVKSYGELHEDIWVVYYKNGNSISEYCTVVCPEVLVDGDELRIR